MGAEEHRVEPAGERCEECGARLTKQELQRVLENGGPSLCTTHATEIAQVDEDGSDEGY